MKTILCGTATATFHFVHARGPHVVFSEPVLESEVVVIRDALPPGWTLGARDFPARRLIAPTHALLEPRESPHVSQYWVRAMGNSWEEVRHRAVLYYEKAHNLDAAEANQRAWACLELRVTEGEAASLARQWAEEGAMTWGAPGVTLWKIEDKGDEHVLVRNGRAVAALRGISLTWVQADALAARIERLLNSEEPL